MTAGRPRVSRDQLRTLFIEAGWAILREEGLGAGGDALTLKRVRERHLDLPQVNRVNLNHAFVLSGVGFVLLIRQIFVQGPQQKAAISI